ncbi:MAG TPA: DUF1587 domain-containing protein, partial [Vicinamibacterales bacterium]|nr:DUF1587 domain-containing protein [Vicinamibacterales bacterium]
MRAWTVALVIVSWASWASWAGWVGLAFPTVQTSPLGTTRASTSPPTLSDLRATLDTYCVTCHNQRLKTAGLLLDTLDTTNPGAHASEWEKVIARLEQGSMPPPGRPRPDAAVSQALAALLEAELDRAWTAHPNAGRIGAVHRLNRTEYNNAIRDLFAVDLDVKSLLPGDETADG